MCNDIGALIHCEIERAPVQQLEADQVQMHGMRVIRQGMTAMHSTSARAL